MRASLLDVATDRLQWVITPSILLMMSCEIRDMIYCHSTTAGNHGVFELCKLVKEEASQLLSKHAVFRVILGFVDRTTGIPMIQDR